MAAWSNYDCRVGAFGLWGDCVLVANTLPKGVQIAQNFLSSSSGCVQQRNRLVLTQQAGTGAPCPKVQDFKNCKCPPGVNTGNVLTGAANWIGSEAGNITGAMIPPIPGLNLSGNVTALGQVGNMESALMDIERVQAQQFLNQTLPGGKSIKDLGVGMGTIQAIVGLLSLLFCCLCCRYNFKFFRWLYRKYKKRQKDRLKKEGKQGEDTGIMGDVNDVLSTLVDEEVIDNMMPDTVIDQGRDANEQDEANDLTSLLSERRPAYDSQSKLVQPPTNPGSPGNSSFVSYNVYDPGVPLSVFTIGTGPGSSGEGRAAGNGPFGGVLAPSSAPGYMDPKDGTFMDYTSQNPFYRNPQVPATQSMGSFSMNPGIRMLSSPGQPPAAQRTVSLG